MAYQLVRLSTLLGKDSTYQLVGTDALYSTLGTGTTGPSLSSAKLTVDELGQYYGDTLVFWNSAGNVITPKSTTAKIGLGSTTSPAATLDVGGTDAIVVPVGTSNQRPTAETGMIRYNSDNSQFEGYGASNWQGLGGVIDVDRDTKIQAEESTDEDVLRFDTAGTQAMMIDNNQRVGIGYNAGDSIITSLSPKLAVNGSVYVNGTMRVTDDVTVFYTSDSGLKKDLAVIGDPLDKISQLNGYSFTWNEVAEELYAGAKSGTEYGVVAQEVEQVLPEAVETRPTGYKAVNYNQLVPLLIECIKDLSARVKQLEENNG